MAVLKSGTTIGGHVAVHANNISTYATVGGITQATADGRYALTSHAHSAADITSGTLASARLSGTYTITVSGNATTATTLATARSINGTSFNGSADITTSNWGTARTITIGATGKSVNGSGNVSWTLGELQAEYEVPLNTLRNNLGSPTVREMALFHGQFNNKFRFLAPTLQEESTDGTTWVTSTRASAAVLGDMMIGEGQGTSFSAIPSAAIGTYGAYRLTWNVVGSTGYVFLNALYIYNSTSGNNVTVQIEAFHNTNGWVNITGPHTTNNWPGHAYIPHSSIPYSNSASQYSQVRVTFTTTHNANTNAFTLYAIEWFGGYPQGRRNAESYDRDRNVYFPAAIQGTRLISTVATGTAPLTVTSTTRVANLNVATAGTADTLTTARTINGTSFNGSANITTSSWGTARTITIGSTGKSVDGSGNVSWTLAEIGAQAAGSYAAASHTHAISDVTGLQTALDGKAASSHTHAISDVTGLQSALDGKSATSHTHSDATTSASGFMSAADKTKLNGIATGATANAGTVTSVGGTGSYGGLTLTGTVTTSGNLTLGGTPTGTWPISVSGSSASTTGNAATATTLATARTINGTSFNGSANITTASWGTARTITIGSTGKSIDGSANVSWTIAELGGDSRYLRSDTTNSVDVRLASGDGRGLRFWDSDSYKIWMSISTNTTFGGRISGETTSDYNMYFRMNGGTNRGFVFESAYGTKLFSINPNGVRSASNITAPTLLGNFNNGNWYSATNNLYCENSSVVNYRIHSNGGTSVFDIFGGSSGFEYSIRHRVTSMPVFRHYFDSGQYEGSYWINVDPWGNDNGWGSSPTQYTLAVDGLIASRGFEDHSDRRSKSAIVEIDNAIEKVCAISGYTYWKSGSEIREAGVIAQDVLENFKEGAGGTEDGYTIKPSALIGLLMKAVKEQQSLILSLSERIDFLETK